MAAPTSSLQAPFNQNLNYVDPQINIPFSNAEFHLEQEQQSQNSHRSPRYHTIFAFTVTSFLGILQVHKAGNPLSVAFGISVLGYYLVFKSKFGILRYTSPIAILMAELANFSVASLASLLLSDSKSLWPVKFLIFLVLLSEPFYPKIKTLFDKFVLSLFCRRRPRSNTRRTRPVLPLQVMGTAYPATTLTPYQNINATAILFGSSSPLIYTNVQSIATLGGALNNGAPYQIVTAPATIFGSSSPMAYRRAQPRPDQIINALATIFESPPPFIYTRAQPQQPRAELSSPNETIVEFA